MRKRNWLWLVISLVTLLAVAGCGQSDDTTAADNDAGDPGQTMEEVHLRMQIVWATDSGRGEAIQRIIDEFEKEHEHIKVELLSSTDDNQRLLTQILSGDAPEVLQIPYRTVRSLGTEGAFVDLTEAMADEQDNYYETLLELGSVDGRLYGFPWLGHTIQLVYNKTLFEEAGIDGPPDTWDELYEIAKQLTRDTNGDGRIDQYGLGLVGQQHHDITWMVNMFVHQAGAELVRETDNGYEVALNSPEGREALAFYKKLADEVAPPDTPNKNGGDVMADFRNQVVAMQFQGPWGVTDIWQAGHPFEVGTALVPAGPAGRAADIGPHMLSIPEGIDEVKQEAALALIRFLVSKEAQEMIMLGEKGEDGEYYPFRVPMRKDLADMDYFQEHPEFLVFIEGLQYPSISTPVESWLQVEEEVYRSLLNQLVIGEKSVDEVLETLEQEGNRILGR
ncbi:ABC-type glycerol-3-phosphate transport system substrate-binding protein [Caldalkalibacillus uzonensis]|uniref:ABC-type glycerol-3-phosphate transport system substrate-binding protein n=1 Tax=Caldalkalibacillus uzonensis TaxID=353224 RepID=A0ABU0CQR1_9BACI|nr:ABC transporter substrate-binding protein [Caldalkalibacillus uzonensis]MDQ0338754.1 ABC-type glycerol-3-phosphate transport system substrate-binding protein [Caldalkalibacillus uzonensis]